MSDLDQRLRDDSWHGEVPMGRASLDVWHATCCEAADELERLRDAVQDVLSDPGQINLNLHTIIKLQGVKGAALERAESPLQKLIEAASAVVEEWAEIADEAEEITIRTDCCLASLIGGLRLTAGIKAPPADEAITIPEGE